MTKTVYDSNIFSLNILCLYKVPWTRWIPLTFSLLLFPTFFSQYHFLPSRKKEQGFLANLIIANSKLIRALLHGRWKKDCMVPLLYWLKPFPPHPQHLCKFKFSFINSLKMCPYWPPSFFKFLITLHRLVWIFSGNTVRLFNNRPHSRNPTPLQALKD